MSEHSNEDTTHTTHERLHPLLDCIAYLLAKRWLKDQRPPAETSPQDKDVPHDDLSP